MFTILSNLNFWWFQEYSERLHLAPQYSKDMLIVWAFYKQDYYQAIYTEDGEEFLDPKNIILMHLCILLPALS